jgi:hypothetical protein
MDNYAKRSAGVLHTGRSANGEVAAWNLQKAATAVMFFSIAST